ncbi:hypothetical protein [Terrabacter sp. Ter38]|uniref:hypothetical protein n=1 Tax=Terrabacter sp. Ter38 TaxID=2926030 RepID=UPI0021195042|nr:hypothetical protein [Terrabacter sp. Ter38]
MNTAATDPDGAGWYEIRLQGRLDERWAATFEGMTLTTGHGLTRLVGPVVDQAALHGLLLRMRDIGLPLVSVRQVEAAEPCPPRHPDTTPTGA